MQELLNATKFLLKNFEARAPLPAIIKREELDTSLVVAMQCMHHLLTNSKEASAAFFTMPLDLDMLQQRIRFAHVQDVELFVDESRIKTVQQVLDLMFAYKQEAGTVSEHISTMLTKSLNLYFASTNMLYFQYHYYVNNVLVLETIRQHKHNSDASNERRAAEAIARSINASVLPTLLEGLCFDIVPYTVDAHFSTSVNPCLRMDRPIWNSIMDVIPNTSNLKEPYTSIVESLELQDRIVQDKDILLTSAAYKDAKWHLDILTPRKNSSIASQLLQTSKIASISKAVEELLHNPQENV